MPKWYIDLHHCRLFPRYCASMSWHFIFYKLNDLHFAGLECFLALLICGVSPMGPGYIGHLLVYFKMKIRLFGSMEGHQPENINIMRDYHANFGVNWTNS